MEWLRKKPNWAEDPKHAIIWWCVIGLIVVVVVAGAIADMSDEASGNQNSDPVQMQSSSPSSVDPVHQAWQEQEAANARMMQEWQREMNRNQKWQQNSGGYYFQ